MKITGEQIFLGTTCAFVLGTLIWLIIIEFRRKDNEH